MDKRTKVSGAVSLITAIVDFLAVFGFISFSDEQMNAIKNLALVVVTAIVWFIGWYFNNCTSEANCEMTGELRARKNIALTEDLMDGEEDIEVEEEEELPEDE